MIIKRVEDNDMFQLLRLYYVYNHSIGIKLTEALTMNMLQQELAKENSLVLGLYKGDILKGFGFGYKKPDSIFIVQAFYIDTKYLFYTRRFFTEAEKYFKELGSTGWISDSLSAKGLKFMEKVGAKPIQVRYYKEL